MQEQYKTIFLLSFLEPFDCPSDGYFRDPRDCTKIYQCANRLPYHVSCNGGLEFNERTGICDWPYVVPGKLNSPISETHWREFREFDKSLKHGLGSIYKISLLPEFCFLCDNILLFHTRDYKFEYPFLQRFSVTTFRENTNGLNKYT